MINRGLVLASAAVLVFACPVRAEVPPTYLATWGQLGSAPGNFNQPFDLCFAPNGDIYVTDWKNHRIQVLSHAGDFLFQWGGFGSAPGTVRRAHGHRDRCRRLPLRRRSPE